MTETIQQRPLHRSKQHKNNGRCLAETVSK